MKWIRRQLSSFTYARFSIACFAILVAAPEALLARHHHFISINAVTIATQHRPDETTTLWQAFVLNASYLAVFFGLLWLLTRLPEQIRARIRRKRRARGLCPLCAYDSNATPGRCSECGWGHEEAAEETDAG